MADVQGYGQLKARMTAISGKGLPKLLGLATVRNAKLAVRRKTGTTGRTIRMTTVTEHSVTVEAGGAAVFLEEGTKPHIITPRAAKALRFAASGVSTTLAGRVRTGEVARIGSGAFVFAKSVHHPGTKPYPFLRPGAQKAVKEYGADAVVELWNKSA